MNTLLLIIAITITSVMFIPLLLVQSLRYKDNLGHFHFNLAKNIDYMWASLLFGSDGHTVSAICYKKYIGGNNKYKYAVIFIDWLFDDTNHCIESYINEFTKIRNKDK